MIQLGKESNESLQSLKLFDHDKKMLQEEGIIFDLNSNTINVKYNIKTTMIDRKALNIYLGLAGAYCDLCSLSKEECRDLENIQ